MLNIIGLAVSMFAIVIVWSEVKIAIEKRKWQRAIMIILLWLLIGFGLTKV